MEILRDVSIDWLSKKIFFIAASALLLAIGVAGYVTMGGLAYGIDFTGGTIIYVKFDSPPDLESIRDSLKSGAVSTALIQQYGNPAENTVQIRMQTVFEAEEGVDSGQGAVQAMLRQAFDPEHVASSEIDFNNTGTGTVADYIKNADPDRLSEKEQAVLDFGEHYDRVARAMMDYRNNTMDGLVNSLDELSNADGVSKAAAESLKQGFYAGPFAVKGVESVGAIVGSDLRRRASLAVGLSLVGMLVYIGFRFKPIYGVAALVALFHDVLITLGLFALTQKEISLIVIAALLTLVGYSVNDSIVVFDRVRENLRLRRKDSLPTILNVSINQTLARTIMTSGMTFLAVLSLYLFGGEVLNGFAFALTIGIIVGTYSSIAIAAPIVEWWSKFTEQKPKRKGTGSR